MKDIYASSHTFFEENKPLVTVRYGIKRIGYPLRSVDIYVAGKFVKAMPDFTGIPTIEDSIQILKESNLKL